MSSGVQVRFVPARNSVSGEIGVMDLVAMKVTAGQDSVFNRAAVASILERADSLRSTYWTPCSPNWKPFTRVEEDAG